MTRLDDQPKVHAKRPYSEDILLLYRIIENIGVRWYFIDQESKKRSDCVSNGKY